MKLFILMILLSSTVHAKGYKCKTTDGKTSYQQKPCQTDENVDDYKFYKESDATKAERARAASARQKLEAQERRRLSRIEIRNHEKAMRENKERLSAATANFEEEKARNASAVADYNDGVADRVHIKNKYLDRVLNDKR